MTWRRTSSRIGRMKIERRGSLTVLLLTGLTAEVLSGLGCTEPSPTPNPPLRPGNRLVVHPTRTPKGLEGVTFPSTSTVESKPELPSGWKSFKSEDLFFRIIIPSSWIPVGDPHTAPESTELKKAERFLGEIIEGNQSYLDISARPVKPFNDKGEWTTLEDYIIVESQSLGLEGFSSSRETGEITMKGDYWPGLITGSRAWYFETHNTSRKSLFTRVIFIKRGRLWIIASSAHYESSKDRYLQEKQRFGTIVNSFKSP